MERIHSDKIDRILGIYTQLISGAKLNKQDVASSYGVNERTIQRDIDDIWRFLELDGGESGLTNSVVYDRFDKAYRLDQASLP